MTRERFVALLFAQWSSEQEHPKIPQGVTQLRYGQQRGWLEEEDVSASGTDLERRAAARILHSFLRKERQEPDEADWRGAERMKDLYDCHTCVNHVAQMYAKGIMEPFRNPFLFQMHRVVEEAEGSSIVRRAFLREERIPPEVIVSRKRPVSCLTRQEAEALAEREPQAVMIDVRDRACYEQEHLPGAISFPLLLLLQNPAVLPEEKQRPLLFYCQRGSRSVLAAQCAAEAGFERVYSFGLEIGR